MRRTVMLGTCLPGTVVRWSPNAVPMAVLDRWQDQVTVESVRSGRQYTWRDDVYVYVEEDDGSDSGASDALPDVWATAGPAAELAASVGMAAEERMDDLVDERPDALPEAQQGSGLLSASGRFASAVTVGHSPEELLAAYQAAEARAQAAEARIEAALRFVRYATRGTGAQPVWAMGVRRALQE